MSSPFSIGVISNLGPNPGEKLQLIRELGLSHIQLQYNEILDSEDGIKQILGATKEHGVHITTVFCGFPGESYADIAAVHDTVGLVPEATREARIQHTLHISRFAHQLGVNRVALHIGFIPEDASDPRYTTLVETTRQLANQLASRGQNLALETGQETAATLRQFLTDVACENMRVNFDPANMILYGNDNPIEAMPLLVQWVDDVHCKDGRWPTEAGKLGHETPLGEGDVNVPAWISALLENNFSGPLTIEREISGPQQIEDIRAAITLLRSLLPTTA